MRRAALLIVSSLAVCGVLTACGPGSPAAQEPTSTPAPTTASAAPVVAPAMPTPAVSAKCPYLDIATAEYDNGQRLSTVKTSAPDGQAEPSCFFYRWDGALLLTVWVYDGTPALAQAIVNKEAPVATSNPANDPPGWTGGSEPSPKGAIYAVAKGGKAIVAISNRPETIQTKLIVEHVVSSLGW